MKIALLVVVLGALLIAALIGAISYFDASVISVHGWIALIAGPVLSLLVGGGLMGLVFLSARRGYDDRVHQEPEDDA